MRSSVRAVSCALLLLLGTLGTAAPAQAITVVDLGDFIPNALNNHRQIVGDSTDPADDEAPSHAEVWTAGVLKRLAEPGNATTTDAYAINASGRIVGDAQVSSPLADHALYWDSPTDTPHQIGPLSPAADGDFGGATGVDSAGDVVGFTLAANYTQFGFLRTASGTLTRVGDADRDGGTTSVAGITPDGTNILGHVSTSDHDGAATGWYLWPSAGASGTKLDITPFPHGSEFLGSAITPQYNNSLASDGTVLGYKGDISSPTYYLRLPGGSETPVTGLIGHNAVNAKHTVVGTVLGTYQGQQVPHAAIWKPDGTVVDLNSLLPADSDYVLGDALAINDNGDIVGLAGQISTQKEVGFLIPAGYVVDSTGDQPDTTPGDGACLTAQGTCTLRAALQEVSAGKIASPTAISFALPGGSGTISPASPLPAAAYPVAIDGATKVTLNGSSAGAGASGLVLQGPESTVRGMEIDNFKGAGVRVEASHVEVGALPTDTPACAFPCNTFKNDATAAVAVASGQGNYVTGNRLVGNARPAIDLGANGRTPNDKNDADSGANALRNFPIGVLGERDPVSKVLKVSGVDAPSDAGAVVDVYAQSKVNASLGAEPTDYVGQAHVTESGAWALDVPAGVPAADAFFSATVTDGGDGTSELSPICGDPDGDGNPDSDGDGLCDDWETSGIDADDNGTVDLTLPGASPSHKDLYLELDAMANGVGHNLPEQGAIDDVVSSFDHAPIDNPAGGTGIALHVNPGGSTVGDTVPESWINVGGTGPLSLDNIKNGSPSNPCDGVFGTHDDRAAPDCFQRLAARGLAYRWVLFSYGYQEERGSSGFSSGLGGQALTVSLGSWDDGNIIWGGGGAANCHTIDACRRVVDAGTLMHEFGHALGLHHGGRNDDQYKPNYLSVMNYLFQMRGRVGDRPLDYSRFALPPLNENALVESAGIAAGTDVLTRSRVGALWPHTAFFRAGATTCDLHTASSTGAIDWDGTVPVTGESLLIHDKTCATEAKTTLTSTEDWPDLRYSFRDQPGVLEAPTYAGDTSTSTSVPEETNTQLMAEAAHTDADGNGVNDLADACRLAPGSDFADANNNGFADVCEPDLTAQQAFPNQANGSGSGAGSGSGSGGSGTAGVGGASAPPAPAKDTTAPRLSRLSARPATVVRATKHRKAKNAKLSFTVSEASTVTITGEQVLKGRKSGKRCLVGGRKGKTCITYKKLSGALRTNAKAGANTVTFAARLGTKKLGAGTFRLTVVAFDAAGNRSTAATVTVKVR